MRKPLLKPIIDLKKNFCRRIGKPPGRLFTCLKGSIGREKTKSAKPIGFALFAETDGQ
jgi:hypothetical protein